MKQPVFNYWTVDGLNSHTPGNDDGVDYTAEAHQTQKTCDGADRMPWIAHNRCQQQYDSEMNDARRGKCGAGLRRAQHRPVDNERHNDELQSNQRAGRRTDDYVEAVPFGELWHVINQYLCVPRGGQTAGIRTSKSAVRSASCNSPIDYCCLD